MIWNSIKISIIPRNKICGAAVHVIVVLRIIVFFQMWTLINVVWYTVIVTIFSTIDIALEHANRSN